MTMRPEDRESLLWKLTELEEPAGPDGQQPVDDETLEAYRRGELSPDEEAKVETKLVAEGGGWERLERSPSSPVDEAERDRLVDRFARPRSRWGATRWAALAAAAVLVLTFGWRFAVPTVPLPDYEVEITGLTIDRDGSRGGNLAEAFPDTQVTILTWVTEAAEGKFEVGLYGEREPEVVSRLDLDPAVEGVTRQGARSFEAPASVLVGSQPGEHTLFVVVARKGDLPASMALQPGLDSGATLLEDGRRRVHRLTLRILSFDRNEEEEDHATNTSQHRTLAGDGPLRSATELRVV